MSIPAAFLTVRPAVPVNGRQGPGASDDGGTGFGSALQAALAGDTTTPDASADQGTESQQGPDTDAEANPASGFGFPFPTSVPAPGTAEPSGAGTAVDPGVDPGVDPAAAQPADKATAPSPPDLLVPAGPETGTADTATGSHSGPVPSAAALPAAIALPAAAGQAPATAQATEPPGTKTAHSMVAGAPGASSTPAETSAPATASNPATAAGSFEAAEGSAILLPAADRPAGPAPAAAGSTGTPVPEPARTPAVHSETAPAARAVPAASADAASAASPAAESGPAVPAAALPPSTALPAAQFPAPLAQPAAAVPGQPAPVQPPAGQPAPLLTQVAQPLFSLSSAGQGEHTMTLSVTPENLGPVTVRAHVSAEGIRVELFAPSDAGREALRTILTDLRRDLAGSGMNTSLSLSAQDQPGAGADSRGERTGTPPGSGRAVAEPETAADPLQHSFRPVAHGAVSTLDILA